MSSLPIQYKVDINPSYDWSEDAQALNISHRELEVFALVVEGYKNKEIAQILKIQHQSVKTHMHNFTKKIGVKNNTQALVIALNLKLIKVRAKVQDITGEVKAEDLIEGMKELIDKETKEEACRTLETRRDTNLENATVAEKRDIIAKLGSRVYPSEDGKSMRIASRLNLSAESRVPPQKISMASPKL